MNIGNLRPVVLAVGLVAAFGALLLVTPSVLSLSPASSLPSAAAVEARLSHIGAAAEAVDKAVSMMFSISLGLFVLLGFALKEMAPSERRRWRVLTLLVIFVLSSLAALFMAYLARVHVVHLTSSGVKPVEGILTGVIGWQALGVAISAAAVLLICAELVFGGVPETDGTREA